jgi:hypothetical protein
VKLCDWQGWRTVIVDDRMLCDKRGRQVFCHSDRYASERARAPVRAPRRGSAAACAHPASPLARSSPRLCRSGRLPRAAAPVQRQGDVGGRVREGVGQAARQLRGHRGRRHGRHHRLPHRRPLRADRLQGARRPGRVLGGDARRLCDQRGRRRRPLLPFGRRRDRLARRLGGPGERAEGRPGRSGLGPRLLGARAQGGAGPAAHQAAQPLGQLRVDRRLGRRLAQVDGAGRQGLRLQEERGRRVLVSARARDRPKTCREKGPVRSRAALRSHLTVRRSVRALAHLPAALCARQDELGGLPRKLHADGRRDHRRAREPRRAPQRQLARRPDRGRRGQVAGLQPALPPQRLQYAAASRRGEGGGMESASASASASLLLPLLLPLPLPLAGACCEGSEGRGPCGRDVAHTR